VAEGSYRKKKIFPAQHTMKKSEGWGKYLALRWRQKAKGFGEEVTYEKLHDLEILVDVILGDVIKDELG
jgi:hypothetical protein